MIKIPLCIPFMEEQEKTAVIDAIDSGWMAHGPYNKKFEQMFAEYVGVKHAITCNSCTSALFLALVANNITGEVIIPSFSFVATANAVVTAGAIPRFVDIEYETCNIEPEKIEQAITNKTQAIMIVHFAGQCCNMDEILRIVKKHDLILIEDSAETLGGTFNNKQAGSFGIGCFSFFPTKNITTGEGGMITTNSDSLARKMKALIGHGIDSTTFEREKKENSWYRNASFAGYNFRMSNVLAAMGVEQMKKINKMNIARRIHSFYLIDALKDVEDIDLPVEQVSCKHTFQMFTIKVHKNINRNHFVKRLNEHGIGASVHFSPAIHQQAFYEQRKEWFGSDLNITDIVSQQIVTLPMYPTLSTKELDYMVENIISCLAYCKYQNIMPT